jgi:GNAT superfamily N-acetyltransferase
LLRNEREQGLPELVRAVMEQARTRGIGTRLIDALAEQASHKYDALTLNVHLLNPAVRLYVRTGFRVAVRAGAGTALPCVAHS